MSSVRRVSQERVSQLNEAPLHPGRDFVLYWMVANRRVHSNFSLQHAVSYAQELAKPLLILEALRLDYPWACERFHSFIIDGMLANKRHCCESSVSYYGYVEPARGEGAGLVEALAEQACIVVTDEFPVFFLPRMVRALASRVDVSVEQVDSNGILPMRAGGRTFTTAASFRRHIQKIVEPYLLDVPEDSPLQRDMSLAEVPGWIKKRLRPLDGAVSLGKLDLNHAIGPAKIRGGAVAGAELFERFLKERIGRYNSDRSRMDDGAASGLSPYLHFGHLSAHACVRRVLKRANWTPESLAPKPTGSRVGWWGLDEASETFLDQIITWRELGYMYAFENPDSYDVFESLPGWAVKTLEDHRLDPRPYLYELDELDGATTHDPIWNAAQRQLRREGVMHNYLRMLWGKKILEWSPTPRDALGVMTELNNRYALDGRNPNSYSGIFWTLGRFDRAWGPERPIFGKVRYMSSESTKRKFKLGDYLVRYASREEG